MTESKEEKLKRLRLEHEAFLKKMKNRGYDIEKLPPLTEQERDEFETVIHNANRTGKFDWDSKK
jgi:hypothetical protein